MEMALFLVKLSGGERICGVQWRKHSVLPIESISTFEMMFVCREEMSQMTLSVKVSHGNSKVM